MKTKWKPIAELPKDMGLTMFVAISITPEYISDPWCVWKDDHTELRDDVKMGFARWPHDFPPTHFIDLRGE